MANRYDGPRDKFKLTLQQHVKGRALIELGKQRRCNQRFSYLKAAVNLPLARRKRGLVDGGGKVLSWLFGVSTQEDLQHVHGRLDKLSTEATSIVHALEVHASLINETLWESKAVADAVGELQTAFAQIKRETWKLDQKIEGVAREMETHWIAITRVEDAFRQVESGLGWLDEALKNFSVGIATMSMKRLPVTLFPPLQVQVVLKEIKAVLPPGWPLSPSIQNGDIWKVYTEAKVVVATLAASHRQRHARCSVRALPPFLAVASDSQALVELTVSDSSRCVTSTTSICPITQAVNRKHREPSCAMALFLKDKGHISLMGEHLRVIEEEEKERADMEVDDTVGLRYPYELVFAIVGLLLGFAASLVFGWHRYHLSIVSVTRRIVELEGRLAVHEADVKARM
ncbi:hypothetical protein OUZ56_033600 [Daphnia magna]|uniref:Uncharacterized protein n=1 Tax=Daphnia magna TaxID=35525 RepID=A0ABQ9ZY17_9CRUS|nr:hypothetical protein OUZ56_033600 [Daphnia magna]